MIARIKTIIPDTTVFLVGGGILVQGAPIDCELTGLPQSKCKTIFVKCATRISVNSRRFILCVETL